MRVAIIGAGLLGLFEAHLLLRRGHEVFLVEAGTETIQLSNRDDVRFTSQEYSGVFEGRRFGLGGTSVAWGGVLSPYRKSRSSMDHSESWEKIFDVTKKNINCVLDALNISKKVKVRDELGYLKIDLGRKFFASAYSDIKLPFKNKNFWFYFKKRLLASPRFHLVDNVENTCFCFEDLDYSAGDVSISGLTLIKRNSEVVNLCGLDKLILAAGCLETTRLVLEMDHILGGKLSGSGTREIGLGLSDHLSVTIHRDIGSSGVRQLWQKLGYRFISGCFEMRRVLINELTGFFHLSPEFDGTIVGVLKKLFSYRQTKILEPNTFKMTDLFGFIRFGVSCLRSMVFKNALPLPAAVPILLKYDSPQQRNLENKIFLTEDLEENGRRKMGISWRVTRNDEKKIIEEIAVIKRWLIQELGIQLSEDSIQDCKVSESFDVNDAYHPVGTLRMGLDSGSVTTLDLRLRGTTNCFVLSTAVLPTAGAANPTCSMLCFAIDLAKSLEEN